MTWRPSLRTLALGVAALTLLSACQPPLTGWDDVSRTPKAEPYEGQLESILDTRLQGRLDESDHRILGSRIEQLPAGLDWATYVAWRDRNDDGMRQVVDRIPEPDAPVLMAEFSRAGRRLYLIGRADDEGRHLVVLTALTSPR